MAWHHLVSIHTSPKENRGVLPEIIKEDYYFLVFKTVEELSSHMCQDEKICVVGGKDNMDETL